MYNSVASLHIALSNRIQQQNSNRKVAIFPQQYDMVLNDAIQTVLKSKLSSRLNPTKVGYEQSVNNDDSLKALKRTHRPVAVYYHSWDNRFYFSLPSNYYMYDSLVGNIHYNLKATTIPVQTISGNRHAYVIDFTKYIDSKVVKSFDEITYWSNHPDNNDNLEYKVPNIHKVGISKKSYSDYFQLITNYFKDQKDIECYFENYDGKYYPKSIIFVRDGTDYTINEVKINGVVIPDVTVDYIRIAPDIMNLTDYINLGRRKIDMVSNMDMANILNNVYAKRNLHLNPNFNIHANRVYLTTDVTFGYSNIYFTYIKQPRPINSIIDQMTDIEVTDEILEVATQLLMRTLNLRDPYTEQNNKQ